MIAEGLGDLDKSGIAELIFKDRHKHSGDWEFLVQLTNPKVYS
jgi:hypothetical protein